MARTAAERRAARKRKEQQRARHHAAAQPAGGGNESFWGDLGRGAHTRRLIAGAVHARGDEDVELLAAELAVLDPDVDASGQATELLLSLLAALWEHGWQPADAAHVVRRQGRARMTRLALAAIARQAVVAGAADRAPEDWRAQLAGLDTPPDPHPAVVASWRAGERLAAAEAWAEVVRLLGLLGGRGELPRLCPPPSQWGRPARRAATSHGADPRMLGRIRGLLAKAESTEFPEEAEALTAKAQELMTRYAVDEAVLDAERGGSLTDEVEARRVHLENPYPEAKVRLLDSVARANGVRVIYLESLGMATMVGLPIDLDLVDLLFTSLLIQATRALAAAGRAGDRGSRAPSFRRTFLVSYAARIGERLAEARAQATEEAAAERGTALVPVMRARDEAVGDVFQEMFPRTYSVRTTASNARGWYAGRLAADSADIGSGREQVTGGPRRSRQ